MYTLAVHFETFTDLKLNGSGEDRGSSGVK